MLVFELLTVRQGQTKINDAVLYSTSISKSGRFSQRLSRRYILAIIDVYSCSKAFAPRSLPLVGRVAWHKEHMNGTPGVHSHWPGQVSQSISQSVSHGKLGATNSTFTPHLSQTTSRIQVAKSAKLHPFFVFNPLSVMTAYFAEKHEGLFGAFLSSFPLPPSRIVTDSSGMAVQTFTYSVLSSSTMPESHSYGSYCHFCIAIGPADCCSIRCLKLH
jgi:hypothetical protein